MDAMENLLTRRSIRKYKPQQITDAELEAVLNAGKYAPTARGTQSPLMVAVQNPEDIALMSRLNARAWDKENIDPFFGAPTVIVVFGKAGHPNCVKDASLVLGNLLLAAHAIGLGACWINRADDTFESPEGRELLKKWGIEGDWVGVGNCILGYPDCDPPKPAPRREGYAVVIK